MEIISMLPQGLLLGLSLLSGITGFMNQIPKPSFPKQIIQRPTRGPNAHRGHHTPEFKQRLRQRNPHQSHLHMNVDYCDVDYESE
jgi:hypothetical protein